MQPVIRLVFGDETFDIQKLMASEVQKINTWTGIKSKKAWIRALYDEDMDAFVAGYVLMKQRAGEDIRFSSADFDTDTLLLTMIDGVSGREVEPDILRDKAEDPVLDGDGDVQIKKDKDGPIWLYADDKSRVPPTSA